MREYRQLLALLALVVMFEGFDVSLTAVVMPYVASEFGADASAIGRALSLIAFGAMAGWAMLRLADRYGRRPMLLVATAGFSLGSVATMFAGSLSAYVALQFLTRVMLVSQVALAYLIVNETLPALARGRAAGLIGSAGSVGAALPFLLIGPGVASSLGWRALFLVGSAPLLLLPVLARSVSETPAWREGRERGLSRRNPLTELALLSDAGLRSRFAAMSTMWFLINFASANASFFFTMYLVKERGWAAGAFAQIAPLILIGAATGYIAAGWLMDRIGRRWTLAAFMALLGGATQVCYSAGTDGWIIAGFVAIQATLAVWTVGYTVTTELFPVELRGAANGWAHNLIGRWGFVIAPTVLGALAARHGIGPAATWLGTAAYLGVPLALALPETRMSASLSRTSDPA